MSSTVPSAALGRPEASPLNGPQVYPANLPSADDTILQIKGLSAHGSIPCPIEEGAVFRVNALQESLEGYWRTNIQAEHAAGFIGASEEL